MITGVIINIGGDEITVTLEEARQLYSALAGMFNSNTTTIYPNTITTIPYSVGC